MLQPLFVPAPIVKKADPEGGELPPDISAWPVRIRDEFSKVAPYAWDYPAEVVISEKDEKRGFGLGHLIVTSKTNMPPGQAMGQIGEKFGVRTVKVPVIVEDWRLYPLDLLVTEEGAILPLNEERLRECLFRATVFDAPGANVGTGMFGAVLYPPMREYGGNSVSAGSVSKIGSFPMLAALSDTIQKSQIDRLVETIKTAGLGPLVTRSPVVQTYLRAVNKVAELEPRANPLTKEAALARARADVEMVVRAEGPTYLVKKALRGAYRPVQERLDRGQALERYGEERVKQADARGMMIIVRGRPGETGPSMMSDDEPGSSFTDHGPCRVTGEDGSGMAGWLFSKIRRLLGEGDFPARVWSDGQRTAVQRDVGAVPDASVEPPAAGGDPGGVGMFCWKSNGQTVCSEPVTINAAETIEGREVYTGQTSMGQQVRVILADTVQDVVHNGAEVLIPASSRWVHLGEKQVSLATTKEAAARLYLKLAADKCQITFSDRLFHFDGPPLRKMGGLRGLSSVDALFVCGLIGLSKEAGERALARAIEIGRVKIAGVRPVVPFEEIEKSAAAQVPKATPQLPFLLKEATSLGDPQSVDAILSLGFLNLDNVARAVTFVPHIEQAQRKLGILLLQARLGLAELPQDHISRALTAMEHVLAGLRRVSLRLAPMGATR